MALHPLHNPLQGRLRVVGFISGSGKTLWKALELQKELEDTWEGSPFEVVGVFSSDPDAKGVATAEQLGIPCASLDIRSYYKERGAKLNDMDVRREYDAEAAALIEGFKLDLVILAGYVWATSEVLLDKYTFINVHPADLTRQEDGSRLFAGPNGVGDALSAGEPALRSSSHIATSELDGGPLLLISPSVPVEYEKAGEWEEKAFMKYYLRLINAQSREVGARTVFEIAMGNFSRDDEGTVHYCGKPVPLGIKIESWEKNIPPFQRRTSALLCPRSVAVIGASARGGIGHAIVKNIESVDFTGKAFAVNRKGQDVSSLPGFSSILDIPEEVDLAVITVPSAYVLHVAEECGRKGVKAVVCISAGFGEMGEEGANAEEELLRLVHEYNMRLLGPNCMGISNNASAVRFNGTILHDIPRDGNIACVTQSGGLGAVLLDYAEEIGIGFSVIASLGNQADVTVNDILPLLAEDERTEVILLYLEEIPDYRRFMRIASRISREKPIVLLKAGRTGAGAAAAGSHTGSLAGDDKVADALIRKCGVIRVESIYQAYYTAAALSRMPRVRGNRIAVLTNGGGPGILASDALSARGFEIPPLEASLQEELAPKLLPEASVRNPVDLVASAAPEHYAHALRSVVESGAYDAAVFLCIPPATVDTGEVARKIAEEVEKLGTSIEGFPLIACFFGPNLGLPGRKALHGAGIPTVAYPEQGGEVLASMRELPVGYRSYEEPAYPQPGETLLKVRETLALEEGGAFASTAAVETILRAYGLRLVPSLFLPVDAAQPLAEITADNLADRLEEAQISFPVVAKIEAPDILHKSDEGGVILGITGAESLKEAVSELLQRFVSAHGILIQEQIEAETEVILGAIKDPSVGHAVMVGLGGTSVELLGDVAFAHVPFTAEEAKRAISSLKTYPLLTGYRGSTPVDIDDLIEHMLRLSRLLVDFPEIAELDLNPLLYSARNSRFYVADYRLRKEE